MKFTAEFCAGDLHLNHLITHSSEYLCVLQPKVNANVFTANVQQLRIYFSVAAKPGLGMSFFCRFFFCFVAIFCRCASVLLTRKDLEFVF